MSATTRLLDPIDRNSEVLFGLIMALSFTCSISAAGAGREDVRELLVGAIGCNIAWGLIDAIIFLLVSITERARGISMLREIRRAPGSESSRAIIESSLPPVIAHALTGGDYDRIREHLRQMSEPPARPRLRKADWLAALGVFLLVFLATFPVVIPFMVMSDTFAAMRVSNAVALVMLFMAGYSFGRHAQYRPWRMGLIMMLVGSVLVGITIALGG